jgi:hypothetical protein
MSDYLAKQLPDWKGSWEGGVALKAIELLKKHHRSQINRLIRSGQNVELYVNDLRACKTQLTSYAKVEKRNEEDKKREYKIHKIIESPKEMKEMIMALTDYLSDQNIADDKAKEWKQYAKEKMDAREQDRRKAQKKEGDSWNVYRYGDS